MEFPNQSKINKLSALIYDELASMIDRDYVLIDVPNHRNIGDNMIWKGELEFLKKIPHKLLYSANMHTYRASKIPLDVVILLHGGGNFGDFYVDSHELKVNIIRQFPAHRILLFPQTVYYKNEALLAEHTKVFNGHHDLVLCARDRVSEQVLLRHVKHEKVRLLPDMAFFIDLSKSLVTPSTRKMLYLKRVDKELNGNCRFADVEAFLGSDGGMERVEIKDWPTFSMNSTIKRLAATFDALESKVARALTDVPIVGRVVDDNFGLNPRSNMERYIEMGVNFISAYEKIATTRLHGAILPILMNKKVGIVDNFYGKNSSFYNTWLSDFENVTLIGERGK